MFESRKGCSKAEKDALNRKRMFQNSFKTKKNAIYYPFVTKSVQKWGRTSHARKRAARTHISYTFQNGIRTHTHTCDRTSHVCVRARTFATQSLLYSITAVADQGSQAKPLCYWFPNSQAGVIISLASTDGLTVLATGQRQYTKLVLSTILQHFAYNEIQ